MRRLLNTVLLLVLPACVGAGAAARHNVLLPAMKMAWTSIKTDAVRGGATVMDVSSMTQALQSGEIEKVAAVDWSSLRDAALRGISARLTAGEIGPGVAESLRTRVTAFGMALDRLVWVPVTHSSNHLRRGRPPTWWSSRYRSGTRWYGYEPGTSTFALRHHRQSFLERKSHGCR